MVNISQSLGCKLTSNVSWWNIYVPSQEQRTCNKPNISGRCLRKQIATAVAFCSTYEISMIWVNILSSSFIFFCYKSRQHPPPHNRPVHQIKGKKKPSFNDCCHIATRQPLSVLRRNYWGGLTTVCFTNTDSHIHKHSFSACLYFMYEYVLIALTNQPKNKPLHPVQYTQIQFSPCSEVI